MGPRARGAKKLRWLAYSQTDNALDVRGEFGERPDELGAAALHRRALERLVLPVCPDSSMYTVCYTISVLLRGGRPGTVHVERPFVVKDGSIDYSATPLAAAYFCELDATPPILLAGTSIAALRFVNNPHTPSVEVPLFDVAATPRYLGELASGSDAPEDDLRWLEEVDLQASSTRRSRAGMTCRRRASRGR